MGGQQFKSRSDPKIPSLKCLAVVIVQSATVPVGHSSDIKTKTGNIYYGSTSVDGVRLTVKINRFCKTIIGT